MNDNEVSLYQFHNNEIRVVMIEGERGVEPWFVAADVCRALGLTNTSASLRPLSDDEKGVESLYTLLNGVEVKEEKQMVNVYPISHLTEVCQELGMDVRDVYQEAA